ncbi:hypothetical protein JB92DRAFT_1227350 [Gautieria morchelliformis]|nr:hypothetical protein JB92DRAFT_1227350 [Gautieria morchelliformis]
MKAGSSTAPTTKPPAFPTVKGLPEPLKLTPMAPPLTKDDGLKNKAQGLQRPSSLSSRKSVPSPLPRRANLVLPTSEDTFSTPPRSIPISQGASAVRRTIRYVSGILFPGANKGGKGKGVDTQKDVIGRELARLWSVLEEHEQWTSGGLDGVKRVVVIGIHGWFPGSIIRQVLGEPTGTSRKFGNMLASAVEDYADRHGTVLDKLTKIVLEGEGTIERRVNSLYQEYLSHEDWVEDLQNRADAILLATHSQGSIVSR